MNPSPSTQPLPRRRRNASRPQPRRAMLAGALLSGLLLASGCAGPGRHAEAPAPVLAAPGYRAAAVAVSHWQGSWLIAGVQVPVVLSAPASGPRGPLLVYLPGLGEAADAGERWRNRWAAAGYTVLSAQLLASDALAWQSELARAGEFKALARERHASGEMQRRLDLLLALLAQARNRGQAGEALLQAATAQPLVLAGLDLGAYTAMAAAGEQLPAVHQPDLAAAGWTLKAVLAISPQAQAGAAATRYAAVQVPVLSITSTADHDLLGLVDSPARRAQPFQQMQSGQRLLLTLDGLPHAALAGAANALPLPRADAGSPRAGGGEGSGKGGRGGAGGGGGGDGGGGGHGQGGQRGSKAMADGAAGAGADAGPGSTALSEAGAQARLDGARVVSVAFLDAHARGNVQALSWLTQDAAGWLAPVGRLRAP